MATERSNITEGRYLLKFRDDNMYLKVWPTFDSEAARVLALYAAVHEDGLTTSFPEEETPLLLISSRKGFRFFLPNAKNPASPRILYVGEEQLVNGPLSTYGFNFHKIPVTEGARPYICEYANFQAKIELLSTDIEELANEAQRMELAGSGNLRDLRGLVSYWVTAAEVAGE